MVIDVFHFPFYGTILILAIFSGIFYIYYNLKNDICNKNYILYYFIMFITFCFIGAKFYTSIVYLESNLFEASLSSYGALLGVILSSIIFEKIVPLNNKLIKYTILSLPLIYGISKLGCFLSGCCYGIPYSGPLYVIYKNNLNIKLFPIQLLESIIFILIFIICNKFKTKKNIAYITLITCNILKFILDFLRYDHLNMIITKNQIVSLVLILLVVLFYKYRKKVLI